MHLYTFTNDHFRPLEERFRSTLKDDFEVVCLNENFETEGAVAGGLPVWKYKPEKLIEAIQTNWGDIIVFSDIDIQFFRKTKTLIDRHINNNDIVFQSHSIAWRKTINIGFMAIRCNEACLNLWSRTLETVIRTQRHDQAVLMELLGIWPENGLGRYPSKTFKPEVNVRWALFPRSVFCYSGVEAIDADVPRGIVLHHATFATTLAQKLDQMRVVENRVNYAHLHPWRSAIQHARKALTHRWFNAKQGLYLLQAHIRHNMSNMSKRVNR